MRIALILFLFTLPSQCFAQINELVNRSNEPCKSSLVQLQNFWKQEKVNTSTVEKGFSLAEQYHKDELEKHCGTVNGLESKFLAELIIKTKDTTAVDFYFRHLDSYEGSASEPLNDQFEKILLNYPDYTVRKVESMNPEKQKELAFRLASGFFNNTYSDSKTDPIKHFWKRHKTLNEQYSNSEFVQLIIDEINQL